MISESLVHLGEKKSGIRELFEYGLRQAAVVGKENVYDYSLGNPSVPAPEEVASIIRELLEGDSLARMATRPQAARRRPQQAVADDRRSAAAIRSAGEHLLHLRRGPGPCRRPPRAGRRRCRIRCHRPVFPGISGLCVLQRRQIRRGSRPIRRISRSISPLWSARSRRTRRPFWSILRTIPPV